MKLILDQGLPRTTTTDLSEANHDAVHAADVGLSRASDNEIVEWARNQLRTIVTMDADFHTILALSGATAPSVIRIRIEGLGASGVAEIIETVIAQCSDDLESGAAITVTNESIRVRRLPILGSRTSESTD